MGRSRLLIKFVGYSVLNTDRRQIDFQTINCDKYHRFQVPIYSSLILSFLVYLGQNNFPRQLVSVKQTWDGKKGTNS